MLKKEGEEMRSRVLCIMGFAVAIALLVFAGCDSITGPNPNEHLITTPVDNQVFYLQHSDGHTFVAIRICWQNGPSAAEIPTIHVVLNGWTPDLPRFQELDKPNPGPDSCITVRFNDVPPGYYDMEVWFGNNGLTSGRFYIKNR